MRKKVNKTERERIGNIFLVIDENGGYLDADFNWYVELTEEEKSEVHEGVLKIQEALFNSLSRIEDEEEE